MFFEDGCKPVIDEFWQRSGKNPANDFYPDPDGKHRCWVCGWCSKSTDPRYLKAHLKRKKHKWQTKHAKLTAKKDVERDKLQERQKKLSKLRWGANEIKIVDTLNT